MPDQFQDTQALIADVWYLKNIEFGENENRRSVKIITQNFNGPCSFIAICNILILRGSIEILPPTRQTVSYEFLSQLVADYLLTNCPDVDISAALSIMPYTQKGMDLNPLFTGSRSFRPGGTGGELKLFEQVGIELVHGWLVDPDSTEARVLSKTPDYDTAVMLIADADHITKGQLVVEESDIPQAGSSKSAAGPSSPRFTDEEKEKIEDATVVRRFLDSTQSQFTYHGLFHLATSIPPGSLVALYRNLHLSVLYKRASTPSNPFSDPSSSSSSSNPSAVASSSSDPSTSASASTSTSAPPPETNTGDTSLYTLVTDQVFLHEPSIVWERLEDIDGGWSTFVDPSFIKSSPAGGDFAGQTAEEALRAAEIEAGNFVASDPADLALAQQLQAEENDRARREREYYAQERERRRQAEIERQQAIEDKKRRKGKKECVVM